MLREPKDAVGRKDSALTWGRCWPLVLLVLYSTILGCHLMHVGSWDLSVPWSYPFPTYDELWQLHLTKSVLDNGWILQNPYLGAPAVAQWYVNPAPQTSSLHSALMWLLGIFIKDAVRVQQVYFLLNFPLIAASTYCAARVLRIGRIPALIVAALFAFLAYRFNFQYYSYLPNYFCIPLALIPVYWTMMGRYADEADAEGRRVHRLLASRAFLAGAGCTVLTVLSDGYYAFFMLLLLGFAIGARILRGDWCKPRRLLAPVALVLVLIGLASAMMLPLKEYQRTHHDEFYPGGVLDPSMSKRPFEAELYSTSLKLLVAPLPGAHRIPLFGEIGNKLLASSNEARKHAQGDVIPLGVLGSGLLFLCFALIAVQATGWTLSLGRGDGDRYLSRVVWISLALALLAFLCAIGGGLGTLIAFVYPSIRAYERMGVFLILILYLGAAAAATAFIRGASSHRVRSIRIVLVLAVGLLAHLDQIPANTWRGKDSDRERFLAERAFVHKIEASLPTGSMVYNYPYSQYLSDSPYYGWGAYGQIRLYMHSHALRWSNGSSKNTPVDSWHAREAGESPEQLLAEMAAVGFRAVVVDRMVVGDEEYQRLKRAADQVGAGRLIEDEASRLAFFTLPDPGYRLSYDASFRSPATLVVNDRKAFESEHVLPPEVKRQSVMDILAQHPEAGEVRISALQYPNAFVDTAKLMQGSGIAAIDMAKLEGGLQCAFNEHGDIALTLRNGSDFPWSLNAGNLPLTIGVNLLKTDGSVLRWDESIRVRDRVRLDVGQTVGFSFPMAKVREQAIPLSDGKVVDARFALLQEGNAWSNTIHCKVQVTP